MKYVDKEALLKATRKGQIAIQATQLAEQYTEVELNALLDTADYARWTPPEDPNEQPFQLLKKEGEAQVPRQIRKWHPLEDRFLRNTYMYLTDTVMALALNVPVTVILARRRVLGLRKKINNHLDVIIWCERDDFEGDMQRQVLTKARPDVEF